MSPQIEIDHLVLVVDELEAASRRLVAETGLHSLGGGRHHGLGTANHIVPLGDAYLELLAVVDERQAADNPWGRWALAATGDGRAIHAVCLRTPSIRATAARLGTPLGKIARTTPQGQELRARLTGTAEALGPDQLPFFIQWDLPDQDLPGRQPIRHQVQLSGEVELTLCGDPTKLARWIGPRHPAIRIGDGRPGDFSVQIGTDDGPISL